MREKSEEEEKEKGPNFYPNPAIEALIGGEEKNGKHKKETRRSVSKILSGNGLA